MIDKVDSKESHGVLTHFRQGLTQGRLFYQSCTCGHRWLPPRRHCPRCLSSDWRWAAATGRGRLVSWVVYHVAYDDSFASRLPYNVAIVELDEGPRLITNVLEWRGRVLAADVEVEYVPCPGEDEPRTQFRLV